MNDFGFIITRHVNSELTNRYWNQCVKLIRTFYPFKKIVVIDDNSNSQFVKAQFPYKKLTIINSEYPGRGEILPYFYLLKYKWFPSAVIIHDSCFIHRRVPFETFNMPVMPFWHHIYDKENLGNIIRISSCLNNNNVLIRKLKGNDINILGLNKVNKESSFNLVFGTQCYIKLSFLESLQNKYNITNLVNVIHNRPDRCCLERIMGLLFTQEYPQLNKINSLFGDIMCKNKSFEYSYEEYNEDLKNNKVIYPFVKVWTGR
jgi:hypothetical protein